MPTPRFEGVYHRSKRVRGREYRYAVASPGSKYRNVFAEHTVHDGKYRGPRVQNVRNHPVMGNGFYAEDLRSRNVVPLDMGTRAGVHTVGAAQQGAVYAYVVTPELHAYLTALAQELDTFKRAAEAGGPWIGELVAVPPIGAQIVIKQFKDGQDAQLETKALVHANPTGVTPKTYFGGVLATPVHNGVRMIRRSYAQYLDDAYRAGVVYFVVMEHIQGREFKKVLREQNDRVTPQQFRAVERAITKLWEAGIAHADLHDGNFMITPSGEVKIIDLGFAVSIKNAYKKHKHLGPDAAWRQHIQPIVDATMGTRGYPWHQSNAKALRYLYERLTAPLENSPPPPPPRLPAQPPSQPARPSVPPVSLPAPRVVHKIARRPQQPVQPSQPVQPVQPVQPQRPQQSVIDDATRVLLTDWDGATQRCLANCGGRGCPKDVLHLLSNAYGARGGGPKHQMCTRFKSTYEALTPAQREQAKRDMLGRLR